MVKEGKKQLRSLAFAARTGLNKYELVIIAAREARHLNELARITGEPLAGKVTAAALDKVLRGDVPFTYDDSAPDPVEA